MARELKNIVSPRSRSKSKSKKKDLVSPIVRLPYQLKPLDKPMNIVVKIIRFILAGVFYLFIACFVYLPFIVSNLLIAPFSKDLNIRINNIFNTLIYYNMVITTELWNNVEMIYTGDKIPERENACLFMNHITSPDPLYLFPLGLRAKRLGDIKFFTKSEAKWLFPFGTGMWLSGNIFVDRKWTVDNDKIESVFRSFNECPTTPLWIMIFLEGRRFTEERHKEAVKFAEKNGLFIPEHTLMPRTKGFISTLKGAGNLLNAVYDITISYSPEMLEWAIGGVCNKVHLHIKRYPIEHFHGKSDEELSKFCYDSWEDKNRLIAYFKKNDHFPGESYQLPPFNLISDYFYSCYESLTGVAHGCGLKFGDDYHKTTSTEKEVAKSEVSKKNKKSK